MYKTKVEHYLFVCLFKFCLLVFVSKTWLQTELWRYFNNDPLRQPQKADYSDDYRCSSWWSRLLSNPQFLMNSIQSGFRKFKKSMQNPLLKISLKNSQINWSCKAIQIQSRIEVQNSQLRFQKDDQYLFAIQSNWSPKKITIWDFKKMNNAAQHFGLLEYQNLVSWCNLKR